MLPKNITPAQILELRTQIYVAVINSASKSDLSKDQVPEIANKIWDRITEPLLEGEKKNA